MTVRAENSAPSPLARRYQFCDFVLDVDGAVLWRGEVEIKLRPKTFGVLTLLVERPGRLLTKAELMDAVWPDTAVSENSLAQCLLEIRRALGDESSQIVATIARRGYKLTVPVARQSQATAFAETGPPPSAAATLAAPPRLYKALVYVAGSVLAMALVLGLAVARFQPESKPVYTQLTDFTDSATNPAISPDGRRLAFIRGSRTFLDRGQIYVQMLPGGEPVALTHDDRLKMAPVFSPDGTQIAFTIADSGRWETWVVPVQGGEPRQMFGNVAALSWIDQRRLLFSELKVGQQMGVVTAATDRSAVRDVYVPAGMAHRSFVSPDGRFVLVASEMNAAGWLPCRLAAIDGLTPARIAGPPTGKCTYAAWTPDGQWMYFSADAGDGFHTWRQRFPDGKPEQVTFNPADEEGVAMWPDGRSFATSVGTMVSEVWVHDAGAERQITFDGYSQRPAFSADGDTLYYLRRKAGEHQWAAGELWAVDLTTDARARILPGVSMAYYDVSDDGRSLVFTRTDSGQDGIWTAPIDGSHPPVRLSPELNFRALFGPGETVISEGRVAGAKHLFRVSRDGTRLAQITNEPIFTLKGMSPDRRWAIAWSAADNHQRLVAYPTEGGRPVPICENCSDSEGGPAIGRTPPPLAWSRDGRHIYIRQQTPRDPLYEEGTTFILELAQPGSLPPAFDGDRDLPSLPRVQVLSHGGIFPGPTRSRYAYTRTSIHRNIYRVSLP